MNRHFLMMMAVAAGMSLIPTPSEIGAAETNPLAGFSAGLHAFHARQYEESFRLLSDVIDAGSKDPRAFYFRGLAARRSGRAVEADADFAEGARLESSGDGGWNIGRSLERVQGADRVHLERYRVQARALLAKQSNDATVRRYSDIDAAPSDSLLRRRRPEMEGGPRQKPVRADKPAARKAVEPEEAAEAPADDAGNEAPEAPAPAEAADVFGDAAESKPAAEEAAAEAPVAEAPAAKGGGDPFGDDPFGGGEPAERKAAEAEDALEQKDEQVEREAAAGDGGLTVEKIE